MHEYNAPSQLNPHHTFMYLSLLKNYFLALAGVAQWIEHRPENQRVAGSIPSQGTGLGYRPGPQ